MPRSGQSVRVVATARNACPELFQMLGAYLHQDFALDYESAEDALRSSVADAGRERLMRAAAELQAHRPPTEDGEATRRFVNELCDYHPPGDGLTYVSWLDHVQRVLAGRDQRIAAARHASAGLAGACRSGPTRRSAPGSHGAGRNVTVARRSRSAARRPQPHHAGPVAQPMRPRRPMWSR